MNTFLCASAPLRAKPSLRLELRQRRDGRAARWRRLMRAFALQWKDATRTARTLERLGYKHDALKWWQQSLESIYQAVFCRQRALALGKGEA